jgi:SAM-dependent methyltransferase
LFNQSAFGILIYWKGVPSKEIMQTQGEIFLVGQLIDKLRTESAGGSPRIVLNVGGGLSTSIEDQLLEADMIFESDRVDICTCEVEHSSVRHCWKCSVEQMEQANSGTYTAVFANYVLEHVPNINKAAAEIFRVLEPGGMFVASIPNVSAPEFQISKKTPLWFHRLFRKEKAWETCYSYRNVKDLTNRFSKQGFELIDTQYYPAVGNYLDKFFGIRYLGRLYDAFVRMLGITTLLGDVCIVFRKSQQKNPTEVDS